MGFKEHFYTVQDGRQRHAIIHLPPNYQNLNDMPVVFAFHGTGGRGEVAWQKWQWKELANQEGFVCVFPDALRYYIQEDAGPTYTTKWDHGELASLLVNPTPTGITQTVSDDLAFIEELAEYVMQTWDIDQTRCYATGFSNGASFVSRLAYQWSDRIAAAAVVGGRIKTEVYQNPAQYPQGQPPINMWHVFGDRDAKYVPYYGVPVLPIDPSVFQNQFVNTTVMGGLTTCHLPTTMAHTQEQIVTKGSVRAIERSFDGTQIQPVIGVTYRMSVFSDMTHLYPNGQNYPVKVAKAFWDFFKPRHK